jgi:hypothetical protein
MFNRRETILSNRDSIVDTRKFCAIESRMLLMEFNVKAPFILKS